MKILDQKVFQFAGRFSRFLRPACDTFLNSNPNFVFVGLGQDQLSLHLAPTIS